MYHIQTTELIFGVTLEVSLLHRFVHDHTRDCGGLHETHCEENFRTASHSMHACAQFGWRVTQLLVACNEVETEVVCVGMCYVQCFLLNVICSSAWDAQIRVCWEEKKPYAVSAPAHCSHVIVM